MKRYGQTGGQGETNIEGIAQTTINQTKHM